jgi:RNA polymerase sigma factor (sigma-70 family)
LFNTPPVIGFDNSVTFNLITKKLSIDLVKNHISEPDLIKGLQDKDQSALSYLYDQYSGALFGVIMRILKKEEVAEEVLQDVFIKIWDKFDQYDATKGRLFTWMMNIARNQAIDKTRSREISKEQKTSGIENIVSKIDNRDFIETHIDGIGVKAILGNLPEEQQFVVEYLYFQGYTQAELAAEFNIPLGTVKTRLRLAMQHLRMTLGLA